MLVNFKNPMGLVMVPRMVNEETNMQAALPSIELNRLFSLMGLGINTLNVIGLMIIIVSALSVFVSLFNNLKDRIYEMALLRTFGASPWLLARLVIQEGLILSFTGYVLGILFSRFGLGVARQIFPQNLQLNVEYHILREEVWLLFVVLLLGVLASLLPAIKAVRVNIADTLADKD
jgi:putative ABC transport system permease protein